MFRFIKNTDDLINFKNKLELENREILKVPKIQKNIY